MLYLGGNRADLWQSVAYARRQGGAVVVSVGGKAADDADIDALSPDVVRHRAARSVVDPLVGNARESAWRWVEDVGLRQQTAIGATLFDLTRDEKGSPLWWLSDITLEEKGYLVVRFVEMLDHFLRAVAPNALVVCGSDRDHPWQRSVAARWARSRKLAVIRMAQGKGPEGSVVPQPRVPQARDDIPIPEVLRSRSQRPLEVAARSQPSAPIDLTLRLLELLVSPIVAVFAAVALVVIGASAVVAPKFLVAQRSLRMFGRAILAAVAFVLGIVLLVPLVAVLLLVAVIVIVTAERADAVVDLRHVRSSLGRFDRRSLLVRPPAERSSASDSASRPVILVVVDRGNSRRRVALGSGRRSSYNPYLEGVVDALRAQPGGHRVVVVYYGAEPGGRVVRAARRLVRLVRPGDVPITDVIDPALWRAAARWGKVDAETGRAIADPGGLGQFLIYRGVPVLDALRPDLRTAFEILNERRLYVEAFRSLIRTVKPTVTVAYNWEGVFRPLTEAAFREHAVLFGVQQALGPYGHAIDHHTAGYVRPGEIGDGFRLPNRLAIWGDVHAGILHRYNVPSEIPVVTGYPRLDAFARVRPARRALRRRLQISDPHARLVVFTVVLRVIGTPLVREADYVRMFDDLVSITDAEADVHIVVKPWPGDAMGRVREIVWARGNRNVRFLSADSDLHNADLLAGADVLVGTFSSIVGEAVVAGCIPIMVDPPEARYYFGDEHVAHYEGMTRIVEPSAVRSAVLEELGRPTQERTRIREQALLRVERIFGPADGRSAERVASEVLRSAARTPRH